MNEALWQAIVNCDRTFDGQYFYGVITTGIFCRPSCRSRTPRQENVRIFRSVDEAKVSHFRPCKRCCPDAYPLGPIESLVEAAKTIMDEGYQNSLTLHILAQKLAISPYHLHRVFKRATGMPPAAYLLNRRIEAAKEVLATASSCIIIDIARMVGFHSATHFSTVFQRATGHNPTGYRTLNFASHEVPEEAQP